MPCDWKDAEGDSLLTNAAAEGALPVIEFLLKQPGVDIDSIGQMHGATALHFSIIRNHAEVVRVVLENGADPALIDGKGMTPLMLAADSGGVEIVKELLKLSLDKLNLKAVADYIDPYGYVHAYSRAFDFAIGHPEIAVLLLPTIDVHELDKKGNSLLHRAVCARNFELVKVLVEQENLDVNAMNSDHYTPIELALARNNRQIIKFLIEKGAEITNYAAEELASAETLKFIAEMSVFDCKSLENLISGLLQNEELEVVDNIVFKLVKEADSERVPYCLYGAVSGNNFNNFLRIYDRITSFLEPKDIMNSLDKCRFRRFGLFTALSLRKIKCEEARIFLFLFTKMVDMPEAMQISKENHFELYFEYVRTAASLDFKFFPLFEAIAADKLTQDDLVEMMYTGASVGNIDMIKYLLGKGVDINHKGQNGTALIVAAEYNQAEAIEYLLGQGADTNFVLENGYNAFLIAAYSGSVDAVSMLLKRNPQGINFKADKTALSIACMNSNFEMLKVLLENGAKFDDNSCFGFAFQEEVNECFIRQVIKHLSDELLEILLKESPISRLLLLSSEEIRKFLKAMKESEQVFEAERFDNFLKQFLKGAFKKSSINACKLLLEYFSVELEKEDVLELCNFALMNYSDDIYFEFILENYSRYSDGIYSGELLLQAAMHHR